VCDYKMVAKESFKTWVDVANSEEDLALRVAQAVISDYSRF
jgi:hypothetical protein